MRKKLLMLTAFAMLAIASCKKSNPVTDPVVTPPVTPPVVTPPVNYVSDESFKIIAYMPSYSDPAAISAKKFKMLTHLNYAFLNPNDSGDGSLLALSQPSRFATLKALCKANHVKFGIAVSGTSSIFVNIAANPATRTAFVNNIVKFAVDNGVDGVDMDWEYPSTSNGSADTFILMMKDLSEQLHKKNIYLSAAVTPAVYAGGIRDGIKQDVYQYVDFFNIMQYDGSGYDTAEPLNHASYKMSVASLDVWLGSKALPRVKAIVGLPCYGKDASNKAKTYKSIEASGADVNLNVATVDGVAYGFNGIPEIKRKTQLAKDRANGIMFWELSQDTENDNSLIKAANDQLGRSYN